MKKKVKLTKWEKLEATKKELNKHLVFEIIFLIDFIVLILLGVSICVLVPILVIIFGIIEYRIEKFREEIGYIKKSRVIKLIGETIVFFGFALLIISPFFIKFLRLLVLPIVLIIVGTFLFLISKFYDIEKRN